MNKALKQIYRLNSLTSKALSLSPYVKTFRDTYSFLQKSQWWSRERLEEYQMGQLGKLLHHAYENVPYYRRIFNERGLKPGDIRDLTDLPKPSIDTGMGLERMAAVMQGVHDNYEIDVFKNIYSEFFQILKTEFKISDKTLQSEDAKIASRVIADHIRSAVFLIAEGIFPSPCSRELLFQ